MKRETFVCVQVKNMLGKIMILRYCKNRKQKLEWQKHKNHIYEEIEVG
jgi:hypothetical protein